jgi:hypothetical protein
LAVSLLELCKKWVSDEPTFVDVRQTWRTSRRCKSAVSPVDGNNEPMQGCLS